MSPVGQSFGSAPVPTLVVASRPGREAFGPGRRFSEYDRRDGEPPAEMSMHTPIARARRWVGQVKARWVADRRLRLLLTLPFAVCLPAAALIYINFYQLKSIERDKVLEGAIHRDFHQMLAIAEKQINQRIIAMAEDARTAFPADETGTGRAAQRLDAVLARRQSVGHAFVLDREEGLVVRSQPYRLSDPEFREERARFSKALETWLVSDSKDFLGEMRKKGHDISVFTERTVGTNSRHSFATTAFFAVPGVSGSAHVLGGVRFDADHLTGTFFPKVLDDLIAYGLGQEGATPLAMSVALAVPFASQTLPKPGLPTEHVLASSAGWRTGPAEVFRNLEGSFRGLALGIKFQGVSAAELGRSWALRGFLTLAVVSLS